jgi:glyoxylase-like metal-dependent hydrolase (beta-lactamase superfamily II)
MKALAQTRIPSVWPRRWIGWLLAVCLGSLGGCASVADSGEPRPQALAAGVYWLPGSGGAADLHNLGRVGNAGFIVGETGVIAIDTGTSYAHGQALLAAIRSVTDKPVRLALITHVRPEFIFGGAAFREQGIALRAHSRTAALMASRCETCLERLRQTLGDAPVSGTLLYRPDQLFDATHDLDVIGGRVVRVLYFGRSSGPGDVAVFDPRSGVVFAGGLLEARRVPDIQDGDLAAWQRALTTLSELRPSMVVPGHGAASAPADVIAPMADYLQQIEARARALVDADTSLINVVEASQLPAFQAWDQYQTIHPRNVSTAFLRVERERLFKDEGH